MERGDGGGQVGKCSNAMMVDMVQHASGYGIAHCSGVSHVIELTQTYDDEPPAQQPMICFHLINIINSDYYTSWIPVGCGGNIIDMQISPRGIAHTCRSPPWEESHHLISFPLGNHPPQEDCAYADFPYESRGMRICRICLRETCTPAQYLTPSSRNTPLLHPYQRAVRMCHCPTARGNNDL